MSRQIFIHTFQWMLMILCASPALAQKSVPILERKITVSLVNIKMDAALNSIGTAGGFSFSYNPAQIEINRTVNYEFHGKTVREIINVLFKGKMEGKAKGNHLILSPVKMSEARRESREKTFIIAGYVENRKGEKIQWASVYNKESLASSITDAYGYYIIELPAELKDLSLNISKQNYNDTIVRLADNKSGFIVVTLDQPVVDSVPAIDMEKLYADAERTAGSFFMTEEDKANTVNITDTLIRKWQVSLIPFVGTNGRLSGNVINDYSLNVFGGYSMGTRKLELAGLFNVNRSDVSYAQIAGISNAAGGDVKGLQLAGLTNTIKGSIHGVQVAGMVNVAWKEADGVQVAGFTNTARAKSNVVQVAGFVNTALDTCSGAQVSGFCNVALREFRGSQVTGFVNFAKRITGNQTGFLNCAKNVRGAQVGVINFSDTVTGIPVGFFTYVHKGYHKIEVSADELFQANISLRTGVRQFYNIFTGGVRPYIYNRPVWTFGYGLGSSVLLGKSSALDFDLVTNQVIEGSTFEEINLVNKFYIGLDLRLAKNVSLAFGPTVNMHVFDATYGDYPELFNVVTPNVFYSETFYRDDLSVNMWLGGKVGIRFL